MAFRDYLETINDPKFHEANRLTHIAVKLLKEIGMTEKNAYRWIKAWASGAGDGIA